MFIRCLYTKVHSASLGLALFACIQLLAAQASAAPTETLVVTATRSTSNAQDLAQNIARVSAEELRLVSATHPYELAVRVPGAWISRGSGQEQLTAIRSPVLTGPGSCGAFLIMEDGIPIRPTGFCNVNNLFEVPTELADSLEIIRGPANAYYGSNGLHGTINTLLPEPGVRQQTSATLETGSNDYWRGQVRFDSAPGKHSYSAGLVADRDGGYRDDSGYNQAKGFFKSRHELNAGLLNTSVSFSDLDQETAGFVTGFEAYKDPAVRFSNPNPEAYRKASSIRGALTWAPQQTGKWSNEYRAYVRASDMNFLQHFLPGQPVEKNGQSSGGLLFVSRRSFDSGAELAWGIDTEIADGFLEEFQENPVDGSAFLQATRPVGQHYDYDVQSYMAATYANIRVPLGSGRWELQAGVRAEYLLYKYQNNMLDGNTNDAGVACGFGGCLFSRPADRRDDFLNFSPNIGVLWRLTDSTSLFSNVTRGFRAPQATELYRLQSGQQSADIDTVTMDSVEAGMRHTGPALSLELVAYKMRKSDFIFRDSAGFNVSDGKTSHEGFEANALWQLNTPLYVGFTGSYARQEYRFTRSAGRGEEIEYGNRIDTAPTKLASARLGYALPRGRAELEWVYTDEYFLDAANTAAYEGHQLVNLRLDVAVSTHWSVGMRLNNLTDTEYADRADLFSLTDPDQFRYFPGRRREVYVSVGWRQR